MSWKGVKKQTNIENIKAWCEKVGIVNYTINSQGEIDVGGSVCLDYQEFEELPYKFGRVNGYFDLDNCKNLIALKNCPNKVGGYFSCEGCTQLDSLEGCPKEVEGRFYCAFCKREFLKEEVEFLCKVRDIIFT